MVNILAPDPNAPSGIEMISAVELFSGCGGLAYGLCEAGVRPSVMVERNAAAVTTLTENKSNGVKHAKDWIIKCGDVRQFDWSEYSGIDVVAGGPPCQPFSQAGRHKGKLDDRDMWPEAIRVVDELSPLAFVFENVRGLMRETFREYFQQVRDSLADAGSGHGYHVDYAMVNAADYGAAQQRHRVIVVGLQRNLFEPIVLPDPSHSRERLLWDQWISGDYWRRHGLPTPDDSAIPKRDIAYVKRLRDDAKRPKTKPWRTVRDALRGLGEPTGKKNHVHQLGARPYPGHTGSTLDTPAKALKAGNHGVPGGENMLRLADGTVRYFTIREMARLQGLPDSYLFPGSWTESTRQLGNAVPVELSRAFGGWLAERIHAIKTRLAACPAALGDRGFARCNVVGEDPRHRAGDAGQPCVMESI